MNHAATKSHHDRPRHEVVAEADTLLERLTHSALGEETQAVIEKLRHVFDVLKATAEDAQERVHNRVVSTERTIKHHPWGAVGTAAGAGAGAGLLLALYFRHRHTGNGRVNGNGHGNGHAAPRRH